MMMLMPMMMMMMLINVSFDPREERTCPVGVWLRVGCALVGCAYTCVYVCMCQHICVHVYVLYWTNICACTNICVHVSRQDARALASPEIVLLLVGNKIDTADQVKALPFLDLCLPLHCLSWTFACLSTAFPGPLPAFALPFLDLCLPFHCLSLPCHCLFTALQLPFTVFP